MYLTTLKTSLTFLIALIVSFVLFAVKANAETTVSIGTATQSVSHLLTGIPVTDTSIYVGDTVTLTLPTTLTTTGTDSSGKECTATALDYVWSIKSVTYSKTGTNLVSDSYLPSISGGATGTMTAKFPNDTNHPPGFWGVTVHVHVDYTSNCGDGSAPCDGGPYAFSVQKGDFDISAVFVAPNTSTIYQGASGLATATITPLAGFTSDVTLSSTGPEGITGDSFVVTPFYTDSPSSWDYNVYVAKTVLPGIYPIIVVGTSPPLIHGTTLSVTVKKRYVDITSKWDHTFHRTGGAPGSLPHDAAGVKASNDAAMLHDPVTADGVANWDGAYWRVLGGTFVASPSDYLRGYTWSFAGSTATNISTSLGGTNSPPSNQYNAYFHAGNDPTGVNKSTVINVSVQSPESTTCTVSVNLFL